MGWIAQLVGIALLTGLLSAWSRAAQRDQPLRALLLGLIWAVGVLILGGGIGILLLRDRFGSPIAPEVGYTGVMTGAAVIAPLLPPARRVIFALLPLEEQSIPDRVAAVVVFGLCASNLAALAWLSADLPTTTVPVGRLVAQAVTFVVVAAVAVGLGIERDLQSTARRLGWRRLSLKDVGIAFGFTVLLFVVAGVAGALTQALQPELAREIEDRLVQITGDASTIWGALALSVAAGVGEETLFRGAIQPRFGIVVTSLLFTLVHVQYGLSVITLGVFALSVLLGLERRRYGTTACILTHSTYNFVAIALQHAAP